MKAPDIANTSDAIAVRNRIQSLFGDIGRMKKHLFLWVSNRLNHLINIRTKGFPAINHTQMKL